MSIQDSKNNQSQTNEKTQGKKFKLIYILFIVLATVLVAVIGAWIINELFKVENGYYTKWEASDALMFFAAVIGALGTIGLGGLTIWQNEKLREQNERLENSNDEYQERIEKLTRDANRIANKANRLYSRANKLYFKSNEQQAINIIIEKEQKRINELTIAFDEFEKSSDTIQIAKAFVGKSNVSFDAAFAQDKLYYSYMKVEQLLGNDTTIVYDDSNFLKIVIGATYEHGYNILDEIKKTGKLDSIPNDEVIKWQTITADFVSHKNKYLSDCEQKIKKLLFEDLSMDDIRRVFNYKQEAENG